MKWFKVRDDIEDVDYKGLYIYVDELRKNHRVNKTVYVKPMRSFEIYSPDNYISVEEYEVALAILSGWITTEFHVENI